MYDADTETLRVSRPSRWSVETEMRPRLRSDSIETRPRRSKNASRPRCSRPRLQPCILPSDQLVNERLLQGRWPWCLVVMAVVHIAAASWSYVKRSKRRPVTNYGSCDQEFSSVKEVLAFPVFLDITLSGMTPKGRISISGTSDSVLGRQFSGAHHHIDVDKLVSDEGRVVCLWL